MKILIVSNGWTTKISGGEEHMLKVAKYWSKENSVDFLLPSLGYNYCKERLTGNAFVYNSLLEKEVEGTCKISILYFLRILRSILFFPKQYFDVIVASSHYPHDVIPALLFRLRNPKSKLVVYLHGISIPEDNWLRSLISTIYNIFGLLASARFAHLIFGINTSTREYLLRLGIESGRIVITTNGVETEETTDLRSEKIFDACFLGRLVKSKGVSDLSSIWKAVSSKRPNARLAILGDGSEKGRLKKLILETGLENNITLLGFVYGDKKYRILQSSKVFIFPSYLESWGIAVAEVMACGLPVVAYNLPIYEEVFEDKLVTVPLGDVNAMAKQVIFLLENPDFATKIGEASREFVKRYNWSIVADRELSEIQECARKHEMYDLVSR
jgi:glycosyltransferase involved in cell wall biosynthesis